MVLTDSEGPGSNPLEQLLHQLHFTLGKERLMYFCFSLGDCDNFDSECGKGLSKDMCSSHREIMAKKCPKMCDLCGKT